MDYNIGQTLRQWRKANSVKQLILAEKIGVTQATISRWENGLDVPSPQQNAKLRNLIGMTVRSRIDVERDVISHQLGIRTLVDIDGIRLVALSKLYETLWPDMVALKERRLADKLTSFSQELYNNELLLQTIRAEEVALISGVSERHFDGFGGANFRHRWSAAYRKIGTRVYAEISFEPCKIDEPMGILQILRTDEMA